MKIPKIIKSPLARALHAIANRVNEPTSPSRLPTVAPKDVLFTDENGEPIATGKSYGWQKAKTPINDFFESLPKHFDPSPTNEEPLPNPYVRPTHYETLIQAHNEPLDGEVVQTPHVEPEMQNTQADEAVEPEYLTVNEFAEKYHIDKSNISYTAVAKIARNSNIEIKVKPTAPDSPNHSNAYPEKFLVDYFVLKGVMTEPVVKSAVKIENHAIKNTVLTQAVPVPLDGMPLIVPNDTLGEVVNARELHEFLESKRQFSDWIKQRIETYKFSENLDYITISQNREIGFGKGKTEYLLSVDMAKEICMLEANEKGQMARRYYIACEKALLNQTKKTEIALVDKSVDISSVDNRLTNMAVYFKQHFESFLANQKTLIESQNTIIENQQSIHARLNHVENSIDTLGCHITTETRHVEQMIEKGNKSLYDALFSGFRGVQGRLSGVIKDYLNPTLENSNDSHLMSSEVASPVLLQDDSIPTQRLIENDTDTDNLLCLEQYMTLKKLSGSDTSKIRLGKQLKQYSLDGGYKPTKITLPDEFKTDNQQWVNIEVYAYPESILNAFFEQYHN